MKKLLLILLLASLTATAKAEWTEVDATAEFILYADLSRISKVGNRIRLWELYDFAFMQDVSGHHYLSWKRVTEYDCHEARWRILAGSAYNGRMATGQRIFSRTGPGDWVPMSTGVSEERIRNICRKP